ncbi:unnamed protein product [Schistocephalus solidus]|uniref:Rootletin-like coiled-coil domain-containing protein n=1 Tax=Schistocephalus solidus TaxID=70667 RepID=A0A3P7D805_SCHSO|nr:unnamed protein product [Schistocephalus solidus]
MHSIYHTLSSLTNPRLMERKCVGHQRCIRADQTKQLFYMGLTRPVPLHMFLPFLKATRSLARINEALQDQLEEAALANQGLSRDVAQLTQAWRQATQQLERREVEWHTEEVAFNDYFASEHNRLLALWREVVALRRQFTELRHQTSRDFAQVICPKASPDCILSSKAEREKQAPLAIIEHLSPKNSKLSSNLKTNHKL